MKNKILKAIWAVLLYIWQLPQNLLGLAYMAICTDRVLVTHQRGVYFYATKRVRSGVTLGQYVFIAPHRMTGEAIYDHEYGHVVQSRRWGWLWLLVFGIPSILHCAFHKCKNYYHFYTEDNANDLGEIPEYRGGRFHYEEGLIETDREELQALYDEHFARAA